MKLNEARVKLLKIYNNIWIDSLDIYKDLAEFIVEIYHDKELSPQEKLELLTTIESHGRWTFGMHIARHPRGNPAVLHYYFSVLDQLLENGASPNNMFLNIFCYEANYSSVYDFKLNFCYIMGAYQNNETLPYLFKFLTKLHTRGVALSAIFTLLMKPITIYRDTVKTETTFFAELALRWRAEIDLSELLPLIMKYFAEFVNFDDMRSNPVAFVSQIDISYPQIHALLNLLPKQCYNNKDLAQLKHITEHAYEYSKVDKNLHDLRVAATVINRAPSDALMLLGNYEVEVSRLLSSSARHVSTAAQAFETHIYCEKSALAYSYMVKIIGASAPALDGKQQQIIDILRNVDDFIPFLINPDSCSAFYQNLYDGCHGYYDVFLKLENDKSGFKWTARNQGDAAIRMCEQLISTLKRIPNQNADLWGKTNRLIFLLMKHRMLTILAEREGATSHIFNNVLNVHNCENILVEINHYFKNTVSGILKIVPNIVRPSSILNLEKARDELMTLNDRIKIAGQKPLNKAQVSLPQNPTNVKEDASNKINDTKVLQPPHPTKVIVPAQVSTTALASAPVPQAASTPVTDRTSGSFASSHMKLMSGGSDKGSTGLLRNMPRGDIFAAMSNANIPPSTTTSVTTSVVTKSAVISSPETAVRSLGVFAQKATPPVKRDAAQEEAIRIEKERLAQIEKESALRRVETKSVATAEPVAPKTLTTPQPLTG